MIARIINLPFKRNSVFLFGPRQVGKSTLVRQLLAGEEHLEIDLLKSDIFLKYKTDPSRLRAECEFLAKEKEQFYVFIDEIQKCPELLDEVHHLIEKFGRKILFIQKRLFGPGLKILRYALKILWLPAANRGVGYTV